MACDQQICSEARNVGRSSHLIGNAPAFQVCVRQVAGSPGGEQRARIARILGPAQQVIGFVQADKTLRVFGLPKQLARAVDLHQVIERCMHDQHRSTQAGNALRQIVLLKIVEELLFNGKRPAAKRNLGFALRVDFLPGGRE